jgi:hypothetical protein|tara:strand:+ start:599 stop:1135 length:537 start_codon:yes stop_codon:yes gene_type:complete
MSDYEEIAVTTLSSDAASIAMTGITQAYKTLDVSIQLRVDSTSFPTGCKAYVYINGDTTLANYHQFGQQIIRTGPSSGDATQSQNNLNGQFCILGAASNSDANLMGYTRLTFQNYSGSALQKTGYYQTMSFKDNQNNGQLSQVGLWNWMSTAAITSITVTGFSNLLAGSSVSICGLKG